MAIVLCFVWYIVSYRPISPESNLILAFCTHYVTKRASIIIIIVNPLDNRNIFCFRTAPERFCSVLYRIQGNFRVVLF